MQGLPIVLSHPLSSVSGNSFPILGIWMEMSVKMPVILAARGGFLVRIELEPVGIFSFCWGYREGISPLQAIAM